MKFFILVAAMLVSSSALACEEGQFSENDKCYNSLSEIPDRTRVETQKELPSCDAGKTEFRHAFDDSPTAKRADVTISSMKNIKTISSDPDKVECSATVLLNIARQGTVLYRFTRDEDGHLLMFHVPAGAFRQIPW